ncbi:hypothetical protein Trydic_g3717 [Trypoxylus dichotomus]
MEDENFSELSIQSPGDASENPEPHANQEQPNFSNISCEEIDKETISKLRGDAIGDTMYSQSSVIRILLQLSDIEWNEKLEEDLCCLWDMTVEKDVCEYLYQLSFPSIATTIILKYTEPRLIEIIIGILGNICSNSEVVRDITDVEIKIVLNSMDTDDHLILIQIMRFLIAIIYYRDTKLCFITPNIMEKICFILSNSTNNDLLLYTMEALSKITSDCKLDGELLNGAILESLLVAFKYITSKKQRRQSHDGYNTEINENDMKYINLFVQNVLNLALQINETSNNGIRVEFLEKSKELLMEFRKIIRKLTEIITTPLSEANLFYFESFTIIFPIFNLKYDRSIYTNLFKMISKLVKSSEEKINVFVELIRYLISNGDVSDIVKDSESAKRETRDVLKYILECKYECEFNFKENLCGVIERIEKNVTD